MLLCLLVLHTTAWNQNVRATSFSVSDIPSTSPSRGLVSPQHRLPQMIRTSSFAKPNTNPRIITRRPLSSMVTVPICQTALTKCQSSHTHQSRRAGQSSASQILYWEMPQGKPPRRLCYASNLGIRKESSVSGSCECRHFPDIVSHSNFSQLQQSFGS